MRPTAQNIVLGAGYLYFDAEDEDGNLTGERYLGDTPGFTLNVSSDNLQVMSSDGPVAELLEDIATTVERSAQITCRNISGENLALFVIGDLSEISQSSDPVEDEWIRGAQPGRWYQLGASAGNPVGVRDVSDVSILDDVAALQAGTDYEIDAALGRIYIIPGGAIKEPTDLTADYTPAAATFEQIVSNNLGAAQGALRYLAANTRGANRDMYLPRITLRPSGELAMKSRTDVQQMVFEAGVGTRGGLPQVYLNGRPTT